jgi:putative membrane protein
MTRLAQDWRGDSMSVSAKVLVAAIALFHAVIFVVESFFWMTPAVYGVALKRLVERVSPDPLQQALTLKILFVNLGFYNLFVAGAGIAGMVLLVRGERPAGKALIVWMCVSALCAGLVLLVSTQALIGAAAQAVPAALALILIARDRAARA